MAGLLVVLNKRDHLRAPQAYVAYRLLRSLYLLNRAGAQWAEPDFRARAVADIAFAADIISKNLFRPFQVGDRRTLAWREQQSLRIGAALMEKQKWLITPKQDTREILTRDLSQAILDIVSGNWDQLELSDQITDNGGDIPNRRTRIMRGILNITRTLCVAFSPAFIYVVAEKLNFVGDISPPMSGYVKIGLLVWVALSLMFMIDPSFREKITAMREAAQLLKPGGKKD
jgi:hypothetical protein